MLEPSRPLELVALLGCALLAGFAAHALFRRHRVSDVSILLGVGVLLGPVFRVIDPGVLAPAIPYLAPVALALVLFEGGLELTWSEVSRLAGRGAVISLATWCATAGSVTLAAHGLLSLGWAPALLFGVAIAATGIFVVIPLLSRLRAPPEARVILTLETALGDLMSAVFVTAIAGALAGGATLAQGAAVFGAKVFVGAAVGLLAALAWGRGLHLLHRVEHGFPLTLATLLLTFAAAESLGGSGFIASLAFGFVLGNSATLARLGRLRARASPPPVARLHQGETIFILRSLLFVYVGLAMSPAIFTWRAALVGVVLACTIFVARVAIVMLLAPGRTPADRSARFLIIGMMPRGLAAVITAGIPASMGVPGTGGLLEYAFLALVGCDLATSAMLALHRARHGAESLPGAARSGSRA